MIPCVREYLRTRPVFTFIIALGLFAITARPATDPDMWWHLRTGQLILHNHHVFHADPYSFTKAGQPWVNHEWLSDVLMFAVCYAAGWGGLIIFFAALITAAYLLLFARCAGQPYIAGIMTLWGAFASAPTWGVRPQMFSFLLASLFLLILERSYERPNLLWWTLPLTLLWVNLHAGYAVGIALMVLFLLGDIFDWIFGLSQRVLLLKHIRKVALLTLACLAVVPLNPYGAKMYLYPLQTLASPSMQGYISEWASPNFHLQEYWPLLFLILATLVAGCFSPRRLRPRELVLLLTTTFAALVSIRHIPIFVLVAIPLVSAMVWEWLKQFRSTGWLGNNRDLATSHRTLLNAVLAVAFLAFTVVRIYTVIRDQNKSEAKNFPVKAVAFLSAQHFPAPILNYYTWGGYFIWKLYPEYRVFIDGRADVYGDAFMDQFASTYYVRGKAWQQPLKQWNIHTVILPPNAPLIAALRIMPGWTQVYADPQASIFTCLPPS